MRNEVSAKFERWNNAADNNKQVISDQLNRLLDPGARVLEIGSGSGQHAVHFLTELDNVNWQPTDKAPYFESLQRNLKTVSVPGLAPPVYLDLAQFELTGRFDAIFSANVLHIMPADLIPNMMVAAGRVLDAGGLLILYGPYKYAGAFTTESNQKFDRWLKSQDARSGIRDIETVQETAARQHLELVEDIAMPANNQLLVFRSTRSPQG